MAPVWRTLHRDRLALVGFVAVVLICLLAALGPHIASYDPAEENVRKSVRPPSPEYWLGADQFDSSSLSVYNGDRLQQR